MTRSGGSFCLTGFFGNITLEIVGADLVSALNAANLPEVPISSRGWYCRAITRIAPTFLFFRLADGMAIFCIQQSLKPAEIFCSDDFEQVQQTCQDPCEGKNLSGNTPDPGCAQHGSHTCGKGKSGDMERNGFPADS